MLEFFKKTNWYQVLILKGMMTLFFLFCLGAVSAQVTIVVLGSSTAQGAGVSHSDSAWVNRYRNHLLAMDPDNIVVNLAKGGYTTFHIRPTGASTPSNRPNPDVTRNISAALNLNPDAIIINMPSNDAASGYPVSEQLANYDELLVLADNANVPVWICTTQGRNLSASGLQLLIEMRDATYENFGEKAIDFWTYIGQSNGSLNFIYDSGDGVHLNDKGHKILFNRVVDKNIPAIILANEVVEEESNFFSKVFPNPTNGMLFLNLEWPIKQKTELFLIGMDGKETRLFTLSKNRTKFQINTTDLPSGLYLLSIKSGPKYSTRFFVKE